MGGRPAGKGREVQGRRDDASSWAAELHMRFQADGRWTHSPPPSRGVATQSFGSIWLGQPFPLEVPAGRFWSTLSVPIGLEFNNRYVVQLSYALLRVFP